MTPADEKELHRLAQMLEALDKQLDAASPLREGLMKAGLALNFAFIHKSRAKIEMDYDFLLRLRKERL